MSKMTLKVLFIQRKEQYEGQHAPEVFAAVDEYSYEEKHHWFLEKIGNADNEKVRGEFEGIAVIDIEVDQDEIRRRCLGQLSPLKGEIQDDELCSNVMATSKNSDRIESMREMLRKIAYPRRGTEEEHMDVYDVSQMIQKTFSLEDLEESERPNRDKIKQLPPHTCPECHKEMIYCTTGESWKCEDCGYEDRED